MTATKRVVVVEINVYEAMFPLVCGYLQAYAVQDAAIRNGYEFASSVHSRNEPVDAIIERLIELDGDIYALSCYVWNMGVVKAILPRIAERLPHVRFVLGGPQVMHHADRYLDPTLPETVICNGEGEITFSAVLREFLQPRADFHSIPGVSFLSEGIVVTTDDEPRISNLDEIPSPFLSNLFDGRYRMSVLETNRGCPYSCGFCYWGAANNSRIFRFDEQRIRDEITWLSEHGVPIVHLADANWGILKRDVDLSKHLVACKQEHGRPLAVIFAAAKNKPERVAEINKHFGENGMISTQPISMQSLDQETLEQIDRKNIKLANFAELQEDLNDRGLGSYIELIWPLPGETLVSFKAGIEELCERRASTLIVYQHMLLHNTPIYRARESHGIQTIHAIDGAAEAELVVATNDVTYEEYLEGLWFVYSMVTLYNCRSVQTLGRYLHENGVMNYADLFSRFSQHLRTQVGFALTDFCRDSLLNNRFYEFTNFPTVYDLVMHQDRQRFATVLHDFMRDQPFWADENAQVLFELDLVLKPLLYAKSRLEFDHFDFRHLRLLEVSTEAGAYEVQVPAEFVGVVRQYLPPPHEILPVSGGLVLTIDHRQGQLPFHESQSPEAAADYRSGIITRMAGVLPGVAGREAPREGLSIRSAKRQLNRLRETVRTLR